MAIRQLPSPRWTVPGASGAVAAGYYVYTYQPGTTTPKATYTDYTGATPNSNPIVLDARGEEEIWWDGQYKVAVYTGDKDAGGSLVWTQDNYGEGTSSVLQGNFNLVLNGSFEQDTNGDGEPDDWTVVEYTGSGGVTLDSTEQIHGLYSLKFTSTGSGGGYATSDYFEVQGSRTFAVSFSILASVATVHNQVDIIWYTAAKAVISTSTLYDDTATNPTSWTFKSYSATAPATARYARVRLYGCKDDDAQAGSTWFDNVVADAAASGLFPNVNAEVTATDEELNLLDGATVTTAEINILDGVTSTASEINYLDLTTGPGTQEASKAVVADANVNTGISKVTELHIGASGSETDVSTELGYLSGVSSSIQTQINNVNTTSNILSLIAGLTAGAVGSYAFAQYASTTTDVAFGGTTAGSNLAPSGFRSPVTAGSTTISFTGVGSALSGTWRCLGNADIDGSSNGYASTLWLRIS